ncbi:MAG: hypothetical protein HY817_04095 [Candidatus Abawacabacteria bacterium]|nr:hypothetical protein [Candidatus Abawacabacteria bacterium]
MEIICQLSGQKFMLSEAEQRFCLARGIPLATISPSERLRALFAYRNEWILFERKCSKTGNSIISCYRPDTPFPVYGREEWLEQDWDAKEYGRPYDFSRPFFEQFHELASVVPRMSRVAVNAENSPYVNLNLNVNNCYYTFSCVESQDCMYGVRIINCRDCVDNSYIIHCELCYECVNCHNCYNLKWSTNSFNCRDSALLNGCRNCSNCFSCIGLEHKQYCIENEQYSKEEYERKMQKLLTGKRSDLEQAQKKFAQQLANSSYQYTSIVNSEDCSGQYIDSSHACLNSYFIRNCDQIENSFNLENCHDCFNTVTSTGSQLMYMNMGVRKNSYNVQFCFTAVQLVDSQYSGFIMAESNNLFGCIGFNTKASYCILNKQYSKDEYEELLPRIIAHMKSTGEYGQWFPLKYSDFPYTDSIAQEFFPIATEAEAQRLNIPWTNKKAYPTTEQTIPIPDDIAEVDESIYEKIMADKENKRAFRFQKREIAFYRRHNIPLPEHSFESRNMRRSQQLLQLSK